MNMAQGFTGSVWAQKSPTSLDAGLPIITLSYEKTPNKNRGSRVPCFLAYLGVGLRFPGIKMCPTKYEKMLLSLC